MIVAGTMYAQFGLVSGHAYTVKSTYTHGSVNLVKLKNPWGYTKYNGAYGNQDKVWQSTTLAKAVGWTGKDDGTFWMPVNIFKQSFNNYIVCMYQNWKVTRTKVAQVRTQSIKFNLKSWTA